MQLGTILRGSSRNDREKEPVPQKKSGGVVRLMNENNHIDITDMLLKEQGDVLSAFRNSFILMVGCDVNTHEVLNIEFSDGRIMAQVMPLRWEEYSTTILARTTPEHRARISSLIGPEIIDRISDGSTIRFSFRVNLAGGGYQWVDVSSNILEVRERTLTLYLVSDATELINERRSLTELSNRDEYTYLYNRYYLSEMIRNEYAKCKSLQIILMNFQEIDVFDAELSGITIRCAAEAGLSITKYMTHMYRYTPKEILVVIPNAEPEATDEFLAAWQLRMDFLMKDADIKYILLVSKVSASGEPPLDVNTLTVQCEKDILEQKSTFDVSRRAQDEAEKRRLHSRLERLKSLLDTEYLSIYEIDLEEDRYSTFVQNLDPHSHTVDDKGEYESTFSDLINQYVSEATREELLRTGSIANLCEVFKNDSRVECEYEIGENSGIWRREIWQVTEREDGIPVRAVMASIAIDTSEAEKLRKQNEIIEAFRRQEEQSEVSQEFISRMSHDIRTPLNAIIGMTMLAKQANGNQARIDECLKKIDDASSQLLSLVNEILDISRMQNGRMEIHMEPFNIQDLIDGISLIAQPLVEEHGHHFKIEISNIENEMVNGDLHRLQRVANNIVGNAIKYTPDGGHIILRVYEEKLDETASNYVLQCVDDGIGMSDEFLSKIFDPFARADDRRVANRTGTGLGMAITRNLVTMLGGTIEATSELNVGSTFTIKIPMEYCHASSVKPPEEVIRAGVLVMCKSSQQCEDVNCMVGNKCIGDVIESYGIPVEWASRESEAIEAIRAHREAGNQFLTVFVNDGAYTAELGEFCRTLRTEGGAMLTIVLLTDNDWLDYELEARANGVNFFLKKPFFSKALYEVLSKSYNSRFQLSDRIEGGLPELPGRRILVAEDNDVNAEIITEIIRTTGAVIDRAENGLQAVSMMRDVPEYWYDMILMDIEMPEMDGYEATRAIRALIRQDVKYIPIVAMTANAFSTDVERAHSAGMNEHLTKPLEIDKLGRVLRGFLK